MATDSGDTVVLDTGNRIVLAEPALGAGSANNITCFRPDGSVAWKPEMPGVPGDGDSWVRIERRGDLLVAWTWSCYLCEIDIGNGKLLSKRFTK